MYTYMSVTAFEIFSYYFFKKLGVVYNHNGLKFVTNRHIGKRGFFFAPYGMQNTQYSRTNGSRALSKKPLTWGEGSKFLGDS
jgi:hypothetical protein